jgi:hypothetical protein
MVCVEKGDERLPFGPKVPTRVMLYNGERRKPQSRGQHHSFAELRPCVLGNHANDAMNAMVARRPNNDFARVALNRAPRLYSRENASLASNGR